MNKAIFVTKYGTVIVEKADQNKPYKLYKKTFKSKAHKELLKSLSEAVRKYHPNYDEDDIVRMYSELSKKGCTYATMANIIIEQLGNDDEVFKHYFGYGLYKHDKTIDYNKLMVDIFACLYNMVELNIHIYERHKFDSYLDAAKNLLGKEFKDNDEAIKALVFSKESEWLSDGFDQDNKFILQRRGCINRTLKGTYGDIAKDLFDVDKPDMIKEELEKLLNAAGYGFEFKFNNAPSKLSGGDSSKIDNIEKWINTYFEINKINLTLKAENVSSLSFDYEEFVKNIEYKLNEGYSISVSAPVDRDVWMTDGKKLGWNKPTSNRAGHQMNFEGFNNEGNILVCSWGEINMFPKEFYQRLEFMAIKVLRKDKEIKKGH